MTARKSPTVRKRRVAAELRRLRKESGLTREQVAERIGCAPVTITRIETGQSGARVGEVALMLEVYGITGDDREAFLQVAKDARKRGWWHPFSSTMPNWFQVYVGLEEEASSIQDYQSEVIPGLLQTEAYARATYLAEPSIPSDEEIERRVALRQGRQKRLLEAEDAPAMWFVLSEAGIRRLVGGRATMCEQLNLLAELSRRPNITIQVLPFTAGAHPAMQGGFTLLGFPEPADPDVVYVEYRQGGLYLEKLDEVGGYLQIFNHLRAQAFGRDDSRYLITSATEEIS
ncbi:helix-turn-helix transcriptional regulator [Actinomadura sp. WMMB 499]|uniref:helix-turn-helix domain-containing protein n=1 Tax=Actinomadura sp. WMMB 499 TaxID=1219491 RepID=UPI001244256C|nr:helix-turn-helix transcriptional regulator [Actinomadura sp. WMMB 499]QFG21911.1 helix-turn-helix domain-containing protein [Actinomadura sp. WMMB 499]